LTSGRSGALCALKAVSRGHTQGYQVQLSTASPAYVCMSIRLHVF